MIKVHRVDGKKTISLSKINPTDVQKMRKEEAVMHTTALHTEIAELQALLYASGEKSLLIVLQGMDTSGKDGAIRGLSNALNNTGCVVSSFKVPTEEERGHDFLWRIHPCAPQLGQISIFNRSHYEDVVVVRVHKIATEKVWRGRYDRICDFERLLTSNNTIILKFFLHITKDQQKRRLMAREADPTKSWKLSVGDWQERDLWNDYQVAYEDAINKTSTLEAPWTIVPANDKWFRDLVIAQTVAEALRPFHKKWLSDLTLRGEAAKKAIAEYRAGKTSKETAS